MMPIAIDAHDDCEALNELDNPILATVLHLSPTSEAFVPIIFACRKQDFVCV